MKGFSSFNDGHVRVKESDSQIWKISQPGTGFKNFWTRAESEYENVAPDQCCHFWCFNIRSDVFREISDVWCFDDKSDGDWAVVCFPPSFLSFEIENKLDSWFFSFFYQSLTFMCIGVRRGGLGGRPPPGLKKFQGKLCFQVAQKSWIMKNTYSVQWNQGTLYFSGQAQVTQKSWM